MARTSAVTPAHGNLARETLENARAYRVWERPKKAAVKTSRLVDVVTITDMLILLFLHVNNSGHAGDEIAAGALPWPEGDALDNLKRHGGVEMG